MNLITNFQTILNFQKTENKLEFTLNTAITPDEKQQLEALLEEPLPTEFVSLYEFANGQSDDSDAVFFDDLFMNAKAIIDQLKFSRSLLKPTHRKIVNPERSEQLIRAIISFYNSKAPKHKLFGLKKSWYKMEFSCGDGSYGGPYLYNAATTTAKEREILSIDYKDYESIRPTIMALKELEKADYNWDELEFVLFENGHYEVKRTDFNLSDPNNFSSIPEGAVKKTYFHYKWLPLFTDQGGNYIGIDLDPDTNGKKGQVLIFGRDEDQLTVIADDLASFFHKITVDIASSDSKLKKIQHHLHDVLRKLS